MTQHDVELILLRQVASYLVTPIFLVDLDGNLLFYNEPAEALLGERYDETGEMPLEMWATKFTPTDEHGRVLEPTELALVRAVKDRLPAHGELWIVGMDGVRRHIEVTAFPLIGQGGRELGSVAIFWEVGAEPVTGG